MKTLIGPSLLAILFACLGCNSGTSPVAPDGTILRIDANPNAIAVTGSSTITVTAIDSSGVPSLAGTEILLATNLGTIEDRVSTDSRGVAHATLRADGRAGTATVKASSGKITPVTVGVTIGGTPQTLQAKFVATTNESLTAFFQDMSLGNPTSWAWTFGDGRASSERSPAHTYAAAGSYIVTLKVSNPDGQDTTSQRITVPMSEMTPPVAKFAASVDGLKVMFTDMSTGTVRSWLWDFGDGAQSTVQHATHIYSQPGVYPVTLTVSNAAGSSQSSQSVTVPMSSAPVASFAFQVVDNLQVLFADTSTNSPTRWEWDFGDGSRKSTERNPTHGYTRAGTYRVSLTAGNLAGQSTRTEFIDVRLPLVADFSYSVQDATHHVVAFSEHSGGEPTIFDWSFGDDTSSAERNPVHMYSRSGSYTVTLTVKRMVRGSTTLEQATTTQTVMVP